MKEIIIPIEFTNPVEFFGVNDANLEVIRRKFPTIKIISRGQELKLIGDETAINSLKEKIDKIIAHFKKSEILTPTEVDYLLNGSGTVSSESTKGNTSIDNSDVLVFAPNGLIVRARTANQRKMVEASEKSDIVFAIGPAGTGKTYTAVALAVRALKNREIRRIILTRPAVEAGENLGFLPGDLKEKIDPYLRPLYDALDDMIPADKLGYYMTTRTIEIAPLAYMRGRTLDHAFIILDEAQNTNDGQLKMFLTRIGANAKAIITGDPTQIDLPKNMRSGIDKALRILKNVDGIAQIELDEEDVVRHKLVKAIIKAYDKDKENDPGFERRG